MRKTFKYGPVEYEAWWNGKTYANGVCYITLTRPGGYGQKVNIKVRKLQPGERYYEGYERTLDYAAEVAVGLIVPAVAE